MEALIISGLAGVLGAAIAAIASMVAAKRAQDSAREAMSAARQTELEKLMLDAVDALQAAHKQSQLQHLWNRSLVDQIYRRDPPPPAPPPPGLFD